MAIAETKPDERPGALRVLSGMPAREVDADADVTNRTADREGDPPAERAAVSAVAVGISRSSWSAASLGSSTRRHAGRAPPQVERSVPRRH